MMTGPLPRVLTVIVNWRTAAMTLDAAESALAALEGIDGALTIVDNDSGDGSYEEIAAAITARGWDRGAHPVRVIQSGHNGGFGAGNNVAIRAGLPGGARPDFVYLLNSDAFPEKNAIRALLDHMAANPGAGPGTGIAGSRLHGPDGVPHCTAFRFPTALGEFENQLRLGLVTRLLGPRVVNMALPERTIPVDWTAGASMLIRQEVLDRIGLFDEGYFLYFEETDLCLRAARAGWTCAYVVESRVMHIGSVSTGMKTRERIPRFWLDSRLRYYTGNHGRAYAALATLAALAGGGLYRARLLITRKPLDEPARYLRDLMAHHLRHGLTHRRAQPPATARDARARM